MWRRGAVGDGFGGGEADALPQRGALGIRARAVVDAGLVKLHTGFRTERVDRVEDQVVLVADDERTLAPADHVVVLTGFRPDLSFLSEVRLDLDPILQAPAKLAPRSIPACTRAAVCRHTARPSLPIPTSRACIWWG